MRAHLAMAWKEELVRLAEGANGKRNPKVSWLQRFNFVYPADLRILDPSVEKNAMTGVGPQLHIELMHRVQWISGSAQCTRSVLADRQALVLRGHKTEGMIPHLPIPPTPAGLPLVETIVLDSKCQLLFFNPKILVEGKQVAVAQLIFAPPLHCASVELPAKLPFADKLMTKGKAAMQGMHRVNRKIAEFQQSLQKLEEPLKKARMAYLSALHGAKFLDPENGTASGEDSCVAAHPLGRLGTLAQGYLRYEKALSAVQRSKEALSPEFFERAAKREELNTELEGQRLQERQLIFAHRQSRSERERYAAASAHNQRRVDTHRRELRETQRRIAKAQKTAARQRLVRQPKGGATLRAQRGETLVTSADTLRSAKQELQDKQQSLQKLREQGDHLNRDLHRQHAKLNALQDSLAKNAQAQETKREELKAMDRADKAELARQGPGSNSKALGILIPSLTSFSASFASHRVKVGMSQESYFHGLARVGAVMVSDLVDHALGLVADSLLNAGPSAPVSAWVSQLAGGVMQSLVASPLRQWGSGQDISFSIPVGLDGIVDKSLVKAQIELRWTLKMDPSGEYQWEPAPSVHQSFETAGQKAKEKKGEQESSSPRCNPPRVDFDLPPLL